MATLWFFPLLHMHMAKNHLTTAVRLCKGWYNAYLLVGTCYKYYVNISRKTQALDMSVCMTAVELIVH